MQFPGMGRPNVGFLVDADLGNSIDDVLALALLYGLEGKNECRVVATVTSKSNLKSAALSEVIARFYAGAVSGAFAAAGRTLPVGMGGDGNSSPDTPILTAPLERKTLEGTPLYAHGIERFIDTADPVAVLRNALTAQHDQNAIVFLAGPATNLAKVLDLPGAIDLIAAKVRYLVTATGRFAAGGNDPQIEADIQAAQKLFATWPTPIIAAGAELATFAQFPSAAIEPNFAYSKAHPVVDAYLAAGKMPYDAPTTAVHAALYAARPKANLYKLSPAGAISVDASGRTIFTPSANGKHNFLIADPAQEEAITKLMVEIASAKPVPRTPRFRRPAVAEDPAKPIPEPAKPAPAKP